MGEPISGRWTRLNTVPYESAAKWGSGINPVHENYEGIPLRVEGRLGQDPKRQHPASSTPGFTELNYPWGVDEADAQPYPYDAVSFIKDDRPDWTETTPQFRGTARYPSWNAPGMVKARFRAMWDGARDKDYKHGNQIPNETVSEGWLNKPTGQPANAVPSDTSQYEIQTSMTQRYKVRSNTAAVARGTDVARSQISSRVVGQKLKVYSGEERHYDMAPYQQDQILRPFWYRTAGTGRQYEMKSNAVQFVSPIQRTPPPDPSLGVTDTSLDYGYTTEDGFYA